MKHEIYLIEASKNIFLDKGQVKYKSLWKIIDQVLYSSGVPYQNS